MTMQHSQPPRTLPSRSLRNDTKPADDRRRHPRYHLQLAITLRGDNNFYTGVTQDLSEGGIFIATHQLLPIGTPVVVELHLARYDKTVTARGTVRWIREIDAMAQGGDVFGGFYVDEVKSGMGVQFDQLSSEDAHLIRAFMECRTPELFA